MSRAVQSLVLVIVGGTVLGLCIGDAYLRYVKESMRPYLLASAVVLILLGMLVWILDEDLHSTDEEVHHTPRVAWFLLLPVLAINVVNPLALGEFVASRQTNEQPPPPAEGIAFAPLPDESVTEMSLAEFATRATYDGSGTLVDRQVVLTGFVSPLPDGGWSVARLSMACCAADAFALRVRVEGEPAPAQGSWVRVTGAWVPSDERVPRRSTPVVEAESVVPTETPANQYE